MLINDAKVVRALAQVTREGWEAILVLAQKMLERTADEPSKEEILQDELPVPKVEEEPKEIQSNIQRGLCNEKELHIKVLDLLKEIGIPPHILGYQYLEEAIILVYKDSDYLRSITKWLYPEIAEKFGTKASRVERAIRHGIEVAFDRGDPEVHEKVFRGIYSPLKGKPTNTHAIAALVEYMKLYY